MSPDKQLEALLAVLVERFGGDYSLAEVRAISYSLRMWRKGRKFSVSEVAKATGTSKQNLSRWLQHRIDSGRVTTHPAEDDARKHEVELTDPKGVYRHLEPIAKILGCDMDPPRRVRPS
jgi:DNA-binding MarR family transcriptional regulator